MYHPSKTGPIALRDLTNNHLIATSMARLDQTSISYPFMTGGYLGWNAKDTDVPGKILRDQRASGPLAAVWGRINGIL